MERSALRHFERAPSMNTRRGSLHALPPSRLTVLLRHQTGSRRRNLLCCRVEISTSLAKPLWIGCKSSPSGEIPVQSEPDGTTPPPPDPLDTKIVEAFRRPPTVTAIFPAPRLETWPAEGYAATKFDPTVADEFFNREFELSHIKELVSGNPEKVILLLGPESCGKTALIEEFMKEDEERFLHLNCGLETVTTSAEMAEALRARASQLPAALGIILRSLPTESKFSWVSQFLPLWLGSSSTTQVDEAALTAAASKLYDGFMDLGSDSKVNNLNYVVKWYKKLLLAATPGKRPVFIIDEANVLKDWLKKPEEQNNLKSLLRFLKRICKEQRKAHVILATSESFMVTWLEKKGITSFSRRDVVLGDLTHEEALRFVVGGKDSSGKVWPGLISAYKDLPPLHEEDWGKVWAMCGGNIKALRSCVQGASLSVTRDWGKAVESVGAASAKDVDSAWLYASSFSKSVGSEDRLWTSRDYQIAVGLIAEAAPYYAVPKIVLAAELEKNGRLSKPGRGDAAGLDVLNSMIDYNVLSVRPYSVMAKDIPREVFFRMVEVDAGIEREKEDSVVVMPSPAHLFAALINNRLRSRS